LALTKEAPEPTPKETYTKAKFTVQTTPSPSQPCNVKHTSRILNGLALHPSSSSMIPAIHHASQPPNNKIIAPSK